MNTALSLAGLATIAVLVAGCSSTPMAPTTTTTAATAPDASARSTSPSRTGATPAATPSSTVATVTLPDYLNPNSPLSNQRSVFFDFDDFSIKSDEAALIERHGRFLANQPNVAIKIEGNSDDRGSAEYNLALGQKRAEAVRKALQVYGVRDSQMEAISWGEEKPRAQGDDEAAWAQNRRADIQYPQR